ncbi:MAG: hypothetical protein AB9835_11430 [Eubacteriales bacterium]
MKDYNLNCNSPMRIGLAEKQSDTGTQAIDSVFTLTRNKISRVDSNRLFALTNNCTPKDNILTEKQHIHFGKENITNTKQTNTLPTTLHRVAEIYDGIPEGEEVLNNVTHHKPFITATDKETNILVELRNRLQRAQSIADLPKITKELENQKAKVLAELEAIIIDNIPVICVKNDIAIYSSPIWEFVDLEAFIKIIRAKLPQYKNIFDSLLEKSMKELFLKIKTNPTIQQTWASIRKNRYMINLEDAVYDFRRQCFLEQSPDYFFFDYINVKKDEVGTGNGYFFEHYMNSVIGGDLNLYRLIMEMIAIIISPVMVKKFFLLLGDTDTGKSRIGLLLMHILNKESIASIASINSLAETHTSSVLKDKKLCLCLDLTKKFLDDDALAILRQITG